MRHLPMFAPLLNLLATLRSALRTRTELTLEDLALRQQLASIGKIVELPEVGGLHHRYERRAA